LVARNVMGPIRDWAPEKSLADMDAAGVALALTPITPPAPRVLDEAAARQVARAGNQNTANLVAHPKGPLAMLPPLPLPPPAARCRQPARTRVRARPAEG